MGMYDDDEDEKRFRQRRNVLSLLEGGVDEELLEALESEDAPTAFGDDLERAESVVGAMPGADQIDQKAAVRDQVRTEDVAAAPYVRTNPVSGNKGTFGGQQLVVAGGPALQVAMWPGQDIENTNVIVTLAPVQQILPGMAATLRFRPYAILQHGTRGFLVKSEIDIGRGCQFSIGASFVSLQVALPPMTFAASMKLAGMLTFGTVAQHARVTRTLYFDALFAPAQVIPEFAKDFILIGNGAATTITFYDSAGTNIDTYIVAAGARMFEPLPVMPDAVSCSISPTGVLQFGLAF